MDYARQWHVEKQQVKEVIVVSNEAAFLQRRYVIRGLLRRMQKAEQEQKVFGMKKTKKDSSKRSLKGASRETSKLSVPSVEKIRKTIPVIKKDIEPCGESASNVSPCSSQPDMGEVCHRDDLDKRACRLGGKKTYMKEESKTVGEEVRKPEPAKRKEANVPPSVPVTPKKEEPKGAEVIVATAKAQITAAVKDNAEEGSICTCTCSCGS